MEVKVNHVNEPNFVDFTVKTRLPEELQRLDEIAHNLWWVWNVDDKYSGVKNEMLSKIMKKVIIIQSLGAFVERNPIKVRVSVLGEIERV